MHDLRSDCSVLCMTYFSFLHLKSIIRLIHSAQTGSEYLVSVCNQIPSQVIPSLSDNEAEVHEDSIEEDELDVSKLRRAFHCRFIRPDSTRPEQSTMHKPQTLQ